MRNRFTKGLIAGVAGGIAMNIFSLIDYYILQGTTLRFFDWSAVLIYGDRTESLWGNIFALFAQIFFTSFLGLIFAYIVVFFEDTNYLFKGWYYGVFCWLVIYSIDVVFKLNDLAVIPVKTGISNFIGSSIFGLVLGEVLWLMDTGKIRMTDISARKVTPEPARKKPRT